MSNIKFVDKNVVNNHKIKSVYKIGNSIYTVNSNFSGTERLEDLVYNIIHNKLIVHNAETTHNA